MSDPLRTEGSRAQPAAPDADRDATIEHLLLGGLDQYFAADYEQAVHIWTRVLFLDRSHARARAYIERARSALAERQRESEELLQTGVAAFERGDSVEARRLLQAAIDSGGPREEALTVLDRLNRLEPASRLQAPVRQPRASQTSPRAGRPGTGLSGLTMVFIFVLAVVAAGLYSAAAWGPLDWRALVSLQGPSSAPAGATVTRSPGLAVPRQGELALTRARALLAGGHLREALGVLELVRPTDPQRADAERLRGDIQRQLITLATSTSPSAPVDEPPLERRDP